MLWKIAVRDIKKMKVIYTIITVLLVMVFFICIIITSAITVKTRKYSALSTYLKQKGFFMDSTYLQTRTEDMENASLLHDEKEFKEMYPEVKDVLCGEILWSTYIDELKTDVAAWCYSKKIIDALNPSMKEGRWFQDADSQADVLCAVVTYNDGIIKAGDMLTIKSEFNDGVSAQVKVIGVMENNESFFPLDVTGTDYKDYRDCYYTYDYEAEQGKIYLFLSDEQILMGEKNGWFEELNYRLLENNGIQKHMKGITLVTFDKDTTDDEITQFRERLNEVSFIIRMVDLETIHKNSKSYIMEELRQYLPVMFCIFIFALIAVVSANVISTKKHLRDYCVYYVCGFTWKKCAKVSLAVSAILMTSSLLLIGLSFGIAEWTVPGFLDGLSLTVLHIIPIFVAGLIFVGVSWYVPYRMIGNNTAVTIIRENL